MSTDWLQSIILQHITQETGIKKATGYWTLLGQLMPTMKYTKSELDIKLREKLPSELNETSLVSSLASGVILSGFETKLSALPLSWVNDVPAELREAGNVLILLFVLY